MIIDYDQNPNLTTDEKLKSLKESVQRALDSLSPGSQVVIHKGGSSGNVSPSSTTPLMDGTASTGSETAYARGDHRHPTDTSRASASDLSALSTTVSGKVDKETGKGLSTNDYTTAEKNKLAGIEAGAEVNVQSDWSQADNTEDDYIKNKPSNATTLTDGFMSAVDKDKLDNMSIASLGASSITNGYHFISYDTDGTIGVNAKVVGTSEIGAADGVCPLDSNGLIDSSYLPAIPPGADPRLITNATKELEAGYSSQYNSYNINITDENDDVISINNIADPSTNGNPKLTFVPGGDWSQKQEYGQFAFLDDIPNVSAAGISGSYNDLVDKPTIPTLPTTETPTLTFGTPTVGKIATGYPVVRRYGNIINLCILVSNTASVSAGGTIFSATISQSALRPKMVVVSYGKNGNRIAVGEINASGVLSVIAVNAQWGANVGCTLSFTYII